MKNHIIQDYVEYARCRMEGVAVYTADIMGSGLRYPKTLAEDVIRADIANGFPEDAE